MRPAGSRELSCSNPRAGRLRQLLGRGFSNGSTALMDNALKLIYFSPGSFSEHPPDWLGRASPGVTLGISPQKQHGGTPHPGEGLFRGVPLGKAGTGRGWFVLLQFGARSVILGGIPAGATGAVGPQGHLRCLWSCCCPWLLPDSPACGGCSPTGTPVPTVGGYPAPVPRTKAPKPSAIPGQAPSLLPTPTCVGWAGA